ncbi:MAG TPA: C39 family peptidase [Terriglobales bacterium]|jgi:predicted double-glycine peptidase|nr:C39 family peptidase [Terriglobales bacterium]
MFGRVVRTSMLWLGACGALLAASPGVWLDVPFVKQEKDGCGAASIAMVVQYWQGQQHEPASPDSDPAEIQRALYSPKAHGIYASDMQRYFAQKGFRAFTIRAEWEDLRHHLDRGRPLIVALQPAGGAPLHYVVVVGLDGEQGFIMVNDPAQRKLLKQDRPGFEREWSAAGNWTLLALPQSEAR